MANKKIKRIENNAQVDNHEQRSAERSVSISSSKEVNKKTSGSASKRYKALLTCAICDADAHGYNFDAISCESCKAFFRRNIIQSMDKFKCRGNGHCDVKFNITKRCKKCRLEKCLQTGMRKEWILSDKEREEKRAKIEENRRLKQMQDNHQEHRQLKKQDSKTDDELSLMDMSLLFNPSFLNDFDWVNIQSIQGYFTESVKLNRIVGMSIYPLTQPIQSTLELFRVPLYISSMRLITYIKHINEFHQLNATEQLYLVKLNLLSICFIHSLYIYAPITDSYHEQGTNDPLFSGKDWINTINKPFHLQMNQLRSDLLEIFQMDNIIIKLFFLILLFSQSISLNQSSQCLLTDIDALGIFKAQNVFTDLAYRYCLHQYGPYRTPMLFARYLNKITKIQQLVDEIKYTIHDYMDTTQLSPLIQSIVE